MTVSGSLQIAEQTPETAWNSLDKNSNSALIDCRTKYEWDVIGIPNLDDIGKTTHLVEWRRQPDMSQNPDFASQVDEALGGTYPDQLFFICRSGARSLEAAIHVQDFLSSKNIDCECINVAEGFEGDPGPDGQRGTLNGWKARDLPWKQG